MDSDGEDLFYPPGCKWLPNASSNIIVPCDPDFPNKIMYIEFKYTLVDAQIRILSCCRDLGISTKNEINYTHLRKAYELKFGIPLDKNEMKDLFGYSKATTALKHGVKDFIDIIIAGNAIMLRLKEGSDEYITKMEAKYNGEIIPKLTDQNVRDITNPDKDERIRSFLPPIPVPGYRIITPRIRNRHAQQSLTFQQNINSHNAEKIKKDAEREKIRKFLEKLTEKMHEGRHQFKECKERLIDDICKEYDEKLNIFMEVYFGKLSKLENCVMEENKDLVRNFLTLHH